MVMETGLAIEEVEAQILRAMAHPFRMRLLEVLSVDEDCVCHLVSLFDKPQPYISQQLAALKDAGLVRDRRVAQRVFYRVADPRIAELLSDVRVLAGGSAELPQHHTLVTGCNCPKCELPDAVAPGL